MTIHLLKLCTINYSWTYCVLLSYVYITCLGYVFKNDFVTVKIALNYYKLLLLINACSLSFVLFF